MRVNQLLNTELIDVLDEVIEQTGHVLDHQALKSCFVSQMIGIRKLDLRSKVVGLSKVTLRALAFVFREVKDPVYLV